MIYYKNIRLGKYSKYSLKFIKLSDPDFKIRFLYKQRRLDFTDLIVIILWKYVVSFGYWHN